MTQRPATSEPVAIPPSPPSPDEPRCAACKTVRRGTEELIRAAALPPMIRRELPVEARVDGALVCPVCLASARMAELIGRLGRERGELGELERAVAHRVVKGGAVARHIDTELAKTTTAGQRLADNVARIGGSWPFVIGALIIIVVWMGINVIALAASAFDPYPFILLNLVLSCLAALQAPIIMMSQNRASVRDRLAADQDFQVNLKAELEIAALHAKLDHLMQVRWESLLEMQDLQLQLLRSLETRLHTPPAASGDARVET